MRISDWSSDVCSSDLSVDRSSMWYVRKFVLITRLVMRSARVGFTRIWTCSVAPEPLWVSPMIQRTVSPAARSEEHTSELQSLMRISYAVFCLKKKTTQSTHIHSTLMLTHANMNIDN